MKYRQKLIALFLLFTLIPSLVFCGYYFMMSMNAKVNEMLFNAGLLMDGSVEIINNLYEGSLEKMAVMDRNSQIQFYLADDSNSENQLASLVNIMDFYTNLETIEDVLRAGNPNWRIFIYAYNEKILTSGFIMKLSEMDPILKKEIESLKPGALLWRHIKTANELNGDHYLYIMKKNLASDGRPLSIEVVRIGMESVRQSLSFDLPSGSFILYQSAANDIFVVNSGTGDPTDMNQTLKGNPMPAYYQVRRTIKSNGDNILMLIPKKTVTAKYTGFIATAIVAIVFLICLVYLIVTMISRTMTKRLNKLFVETNVDLEKLIAEEGPDLDEGDDEFSQINAKFHELIQKMKEFYTREVGLRTEKKALEMELLQSLINPHFLYNTLDGIKWAYQDPKLSEVVDSMVRYYRIALSKGNMVLKVAVEINMVEEYLKLQQFSYESDFQYRIDVEEEMLDCLMIKHILQPIVENAVLHGIDKQSASGLVTIVGRHDNGKLMFILSDNGVGMSQEKLEGVLNGEVKGIQGGYGLFNIQKRLELFYGADFALRVESSLGQGTTITLLLPDRLILPDG
jgi:two-component system sensor histidine kinase YesM